VGYSLLRLKHSIPLRYLCIEEVVPMSKSGKLNAAASLLCDE
jgi:hypothetical protein